MSYLRVRKISIDVIPNGEPFIELIIEKHITENLSSDEVIQVIGDFGRIYKRISDLNPIPLGSVADDGAVDNWELMALVGTAALMWTMQEYGGVINAQGILEIE